MSGVARGVFAVVVAEVLLGVVPPMSRAGEPRPVAAQLCLLAAESKLLRSQPVSAPQRIAKLDREPRNFEQASTELRHRVQELQTRIAALEARLSISINPTSAPTSKPALDWLPSPEALVYTLAGAPTEPRAVDVLSAPRPPKPEAGPSDTLTQATPPESNAKRIAEKPDKEKVKPPEPKAVDVLIVYFSGMVGAPRPPKPEVGPLDTITQATPPKNNTKQIAKNIAAKLRQSQLKVTCMPVERVKDPRMVLRAKVLLVGSPSQFSLPCWQVVRFIDEVLYRIYLGKRGRLSGKAVGVFSTADLEGYARACTKYLTIGLGQLGGSRLPSVAVGLRTPEHKVSKAVDKLVEEVLKKIRK